MRALASLIFIAIAILLTPACGPRRLSPSEPSGSFDYVTTGGVTKIRKTVVNPDTGKEVETSYTVAGHTELYEALAKELNSQTDQFLAFSISDVRVVPLDEEKKITKESPANLQVQVDLKHMYPGAPEKLVFDAKLDRSTDRPQTGQIRQLDFEKFSSPYVAQITCYDSQCSLVVLRLRRHTKLADGNPGEIAGQVAVIYDLSYPDIEVQRPNDLAAFTNAQLVELERIADETIAIKSSVMVVNGPSFTRVSIPHLTNSGDPAESRPNLIEIDAELFDPVNTATQVQKVSLDNNSSIASAVMVGNDNNGSYIFDITIKKPEEIKVPPPSPPIAPPATEPSKPPSEPTTPSTPPKDPPAPPPVKPPPPPAAPTGDEKPAETARLIILESGRKKAPKQGAPKKKTTPSVREVPRAVVKPESGLFKISASNAAGLEISSKLAGYAEDPRVVSAMDRTLKRRGDLLFGLFTNVPNVSYYIETIFEALNLSPDLAYIMGKESRGYISEGLFNALEKNDESSAFGPWQILYGTGNHIATRNKVAFNITDTRSEEDDRSYLVQSTYMAALYLREMLALYPNDPALAILGYHAGPGNTNGYINGEDKPAKLRKRFDVTFRMVARFRIQFADDVSEKNFNERIQYVYDFLALREICQNPADHSIKINKKPIRLDSIQPVPNDKYLERLKRQDGPLPTLPNGVVI